MTSSKWLRGDPNRPFPTDLSALTELKKKLVPPTHEPLWFYRNRGTANKKEKKQAENYQTVENIQILEKLGVQVPKRAHFFKGAGLQHERASIEKTIQYAKELHQRGMMISVYVGGTLFTDYFFQEVPEAIHWLRKDQEGNPITYSGFQLHRWFPCLNHPDYRAYLKKVLDVAVQQVQADEIFFDNQILRHEPRSCRCSYCIEHLQQMIRKKYSLQECEERYGFAEYPKIEPPIWSLSNQPWRLDTIRSPHIQDWIDHRVSTVLEFYQEMSNYIKKQSPSTAVGMNIKGVHGHNRAFNHGICHGSFSDILDFSCIDGYWPGFQNGSVISEVRFWKSSHSTHISVVHNEHKTELEAVEDQVFGYRKKVKDHGWVGGISNINVFTPVVQFLRANQNLFHERPHLHDVAVLRSEPSTNYNCGTVHEQVMAFEQTLAIEKIPWGIIFDKQIKSLQDYRIIALPEIQALSENWMNALDAFMKSGGSVIASGKAAAYDHWFRLRDSDRGLARWLGHVPSDNYEVCSVGKGRLVYVPKWEVQTKWSFKDWFSVWNDNVLPVKNRDTFLNAIQDAAGSTPLTHQATGNDQVFVEAIAGIKDSIDLHFINYNEEDCTPTMEVTVAMPQGKTKASVTLIDPNVELRGRNVECALKNNTVNFKMFTPKIYGLAQIEFS
jgi:hypothetical protein